MANETEKKGFAHLIGYIKNALSLKADKTEIPSLSGYATEAWVQQQGYLTQHQDISGKADKIAVTASDNGKFMRVVNGAWAAVEVPSAESNSFGGGST